MTLLCVLELLRLVVKPQALEEFVRITKSGGLICFTINEGIYIDYGFDKKIKLLKDKNKWKDLNFLNQTI